MRRRRLTNLLFRLIVCLYFYSSSHYYYSSSPLRNLFIGHKDEKTFGEEVAERAKLLFLLCCLASPPPPPAPALLLRRKGGKRIPRSPIPPYIVVFNLSRLGQDKDCPADGETGLFGLWEAAEVALVTTFMHFHRHPRCPPETSGHAKLL